MFDPHFQNHLNEMGFFLHSMKAGSYLGIFLLSAFVSYLIPLPEAILLMFFGYMARITGLNVVFISLVSIAGGIFGDNLIYRLSFFGNKYVERFNHGMRRHKLIRYEHLVIDNIGKTIYFLRLITGVRFFGPVISGTLGARWRKFFIFNSGATIIHALLFILIGYFFHRRILLAVTEVEIVKNILLFSSVFIVGILISLFSKKETPE